MDIQFRRNVSTKELLAVVTWNITPKITRIRVYDKRGRVPWSPTLIMSTELDTNYTAEQEHVIARAIFDDAKPAEQSSTDKQ